MRCFPNEIQKRSKIEMKRDAIQICTLHVQLLAIQQAVINNCEEKAGLIRDGNWTFGNIFEDRIDELYKDKGLLKRLRNEFREVYDLINKISTKYTVRKGIISYEEIVNIIEFNYNTEYDGTIGWIRNLCNADPRFSTVDGSRRFNLTIEDLETLTRFVLGANEQADPMDKDRLIRLSVISILNIRV